MLCFVVVYRKAWDQGCDIVASIRCMPCLDRLPEKEGPQDIVRAKSPSLHAAPTHSSSLPHGHQHTTRAQMSRAASP